jgi:hypothetical protein
MTERICAEDLQEKLIDKSVKPSILRSSCSFYGWKRPFIGKGSKFRSGSRGKSPELFQNGL